MLDIKRVTHWDDKWDTRWDVEFANRWRAFEQPGHSRHRIPLAKRLHEELTADFVSDTVDINVGDPQLKKYKPTLTTAHFQPYPEWYCNVLHLPANKECHVFIQKYDLDTLDALTGIWHWYSTTKGYVSNPRDLNVTMATRYTGFNYQDYVQPNYVADDDEIPF